MNDIRQLQIRPMIPDDLDRMHRFFDAMGKETIYFFDVSGVNRRRMEAYLSQPPLGTAHFIAVLSEDPEQNVAGYVFLWDLHTGMPWLGIAIADDWKGMHLGRALMRYALDFAHRHGCGGMLLTTAKDNVRAQKLYESLGFKHVGTAMHRQERLYMLRFSNEVWQQNPEAEAPVAAVRFLEAEASADMQN